MEVLLPQGGGGCCLCPSSLHLDTLRRQAGHRVGGQL